jgi:hypothetical protein
MRTIGLDSELDWDIFAIKNGAEAVKQDIETKLREWIGDCWFNATAGIDWKILSDLSKVEAKNFLDQRIRQLIQEVNGVDKIDVFTSNITEENNYFLQFAFSYNTQILEYEQIFAL